MHKATSVEIKCILCNQKKFKPLFKYNFAGCFCQFVECSNCSLIFANPRPDQEKLEIFYRNSYYDSADIGKWDELRLKGFKERWGLIKRITKIKKGNLLDVGCGFGGFLELVKNDGWNCEGNDLSEIACNFARKNGLRIHQGGLSDINYKPNSFDVVCSWDTIYFLPNPYEELLLINKILRSDGWLALRIKVVPRIFLTNFLFKRLFKFNPGWLYIFNLKTIEDILKKTGYNNIRFFYTSPSKRSDLSLFENSLRAFVYYISKLLFFLKIRILFFSPTVLILAEKK